MTKLETILTRGYFPKELPPQFFTETFASYAISKLGRKTLEAYKPADNFTECTKYLLALPGLHRRELRIPHPASYAQLTALTCKHLSRLFTLAGKSPFSASKPKFRSHSRRALQTAVRAPDLIVEKAIRRAGAVFLLKADVSQFYPSLYTHAVGWAIDPKMRNKKHWKNFKLLGKKIDQSLMDLDGKVSQGIPIGSDISFLLAECVLARVDLALPVKPNRAYRWYDDYELAFETREEAEICVKRLVKELSKFRLRLNSTKTKIVSLPLPADDEWHQQLTQTGGKNNIDDRGLIKHFDLAFRFREQYPDSQVLLYALGVLFKVVCPSAKVGRIAQSCLSQAILAEPGAAQKAFALLSYWRSNGFTVDDNLLASTVNRLVLRHEASGVSSDVSWALSFCLEQKFSLDAKAAKVLAKVEDDCIAIQSLHMNAIGLLPKGFKTNQIAKLVKNADLDREHWLLCYESLRQGFLNDAAPAVAANSLFSELLAHDVTFYRKDIPSYASVIHPGGAPEWLLRAWIDSLGRQEAGKPKPTGSTAMPAPIENDLRRLGLQPTTGDRALESFLQLFRTPSIEITDTIYPA